MANPRENQQTSHAPAIDSLRHALRLLWRIVSIVRSSRSAPPEPPIGANAAAIPPITLASKKFPARRQIQAPAQRALRLQGKRKALRRLLSSSIGARPLIPGK
jgi:hypothetical protein